MLEGKDLVLATRKYAKEDRKKSWFHLFSTLFLLFVFYAGGIVNVHIVPQIFCAIIASLIIVRLFIIYHDYLHGSILQRSKLANVIFTIFGYYILAPKSIWKRSHDYHHVHNSKLYTSSIGSFPIVTKDDFLKASKTERNIYLFIRHPLTINLGYIFVFFWGFCLRTLIMSPGRHKDIYSSLIFHFGMGASIWYFFGLQSFLIGFLIPAFFSSLMGSYLFYAQHNFPDAKFKSKEDWTYVDAAMYSSSYMKMSKLMHWFTGNIGYHHIHHINAKIPFYKLPQVYKEMEEFQSPGITSFWPKDVLACFRIKVWDPDLDRMITLKEVHA